MKKYFDIEIDGQVELENGKTIGELKESNISITNPDEENSGGGWPSDLPKPSAGGYGSEGPNPYPIIPNMEVVLSEHSGTVTLPIDLGVMYRLYGVDAGLRGICNGYEGSVNISYDDEYNYYELTIYDAENNQLLSLNQDYGDSECGVYSSSFDGLVSFSVSTTTPQYETIDEKYLPFVIVHAKSTTSGNSFECNYNYLELRRLKDAGYRFVAFCNGIPALFNMDGRSASFTMLNVNGTAGIYVNEWELPISGSPVIKESKLIAFDN